MRTFWLPLLILFGALALGPVIHVWGKVILRQISPLMPYSLLTRMPYGDIPRVPGRFAVMVILCLSVIAASGASILLKRLSPKAQFRTAALLTAMAVAENAVVPMMTMAPDDPPLLHKIRDDPRRSGVLEVPISDNPGDYPRRMLYQTIHDKPIYDGYLARSLPPLPFDAVPGFAQFKTLSNGVDDVVVYDSAQLRSISRAVLNSYSAGYVLIEKSFMRPEAVQRLFARRRRRRKRGLLPAHGESGATTT
jgi:hypothetical protein